MASASKHLLFAIIIKESKALIKYHLQDIIVERKIINMDISTETMTVKKYTDQTKIARATASSAATTI